MKRVFPLTAPLFALIFGSAVVTGCGGGGGGSTGISSVDNGTSGSLASGSIAGLGSIIVNGVRYDDTDAKVLDLEGEDYLDMLKIGMNVIVDGGTLQSVTGKNYSYTSSASRIIVSEAFQGPISAVTADSITIFGASVSCLPETIVEKNNAVSACINLAANDFAEVYATYDSLSKLWKASRIEVSGASNVYKSQGYVTNLRPGVSFELNGEVFDISAPNLQSVQENEEVHVVFSNGGNAPFWNVNKIIPASIQPKVVSLWKDFDFDDRSIELEGVVSNLSTPQFEVKGIVVDGSGISLSGLTDGSYVEVKGRFSNGVLIAERLERDDFEMKRSKFELHGQVTGLNSSELSLGAGDFQVRGVTVTFSTVDNTTRLQGQIQDGSLVEVDGVLNNGVFIASRIGLENAEDWRGNTPSDRLDDQSYSARSSDDSSLDRRNDDEHDDDDGYDDDYDNKFDD